MPGLTHLNIAIRDASANDIPEIVRQRRGMFEDMNYKDSTSLDAMMLATSNYLAQAMIEGSFRAWLAFDGEHVVGGGAVVISAWPAHPCDMGNLRAEILNVYTYPAYRRCGIARKIMHTMIDWCKREGFARVTLHTSDEGRHLYESMGFVPTNEMRLGLR